jgi:hypothetical protein
MSMILLEPANTIPHFNAGIKRRTISLTGFSVNGVLGNYDPIQSELAEIRAVSTGRPFGHNGITSGLPVTRAQP